MESNNLDRMLSFLNIILRVEPHLYKESFLAKLKSTQHHFDSPEKTKLFDLEFSEFLNFIDRNAPSEVQALPTATLKIKRLYVDGCFDLMHSGHFNAIRQAKSLCETLVVGVISDEAIFQNKGPFIMPLWERIELVKACKWVDEIVEGVDYNPTIALIDKINCSHVGHGDDIAKDGSGQDSYYEIKKAGRIKTFKRTEGISTTDIVGRLLLMTKTHISPNEDEDVIRIRKMSGEEGISVNKIQDLNEIKNGIYLINIIIYFYYRGLYIKSTKS